MAGGPLGTNNCMSYLSHNFSINVFHFLAGKWRFPLQTLKFSEQNLDALFLSISTPDVLEQCLFPCLPKKSKNAQGFRIPKVTSPTNGRTPWQPSSRLGPLERSSCLMRVEHPFPLGLKSKNVVGSGIWSHTCQFLVCVWPWTTD